MSDPLDELTESDIATLETALDRFVEPGDEAGPEVEE